LASLIQLERPELSLVGSFLSTQQDFDPGDTGYSLGDEGVSHGDMNYARKETTCARGAGKLAGDDLQTAFDMDRTYKTKEY
jgi:hypothetical protein